MRGPAFIRVHIAPYMLKEGPKPSGYMSTTEDENKTWGVKIKGDRLDRMGIAKMMFSLAHFYFKE